MIAATSTVIFIAVLYSPLYRGHVMFLTNGIYFSWIIIIDSFILNRHCNTVHEVGTVGRCGA